PQPSEWPRRTEPARSRARSGLARRGHMRLAILRATGAGLRSTPYASPRLRPLELGEQKPHAHFSPCPRALRADELLPAQQLSTTRNEHLEDGALTHRERSLAPLAQRHERGQQAGLHGEDPPPRVYDLVRRRDQLRPRAYP